MLHSEATGLVLPHPSKAVFGTMDDGREVHAWTLRGTGGYTVEILTYGAIVRRVLAPDRSGELADVVLGYKDLDGYLSDSFFMGAVVGRVAGRIARGKLHLDDKIYKLPINDPPNHLHGGPEGLHTKIWDAEQVERPDGFPSVRMRCVSPDGECGYPGQAQLEVTYTVTPDNELIFETKASSDATTPISLTQHAYYNLAGEGNGTICDHRMQIHSVEIFAVNEQMTLLDEMKTIENSPADLRKAAQLGHRIPELWQNHGDLYWIGPCDAPQRVARVEEPTSSRVLEVSTDCSCLQTYFSASMDGTLKGKSGGTYEKYGAFCLECEGYPQATHNSEFGNILVAPGELQRTRTIYAFSTV